MQVPGHELVGLMGAMASLGCVGDLQVSAALQRQLCYLTGHVSCQSVGLSSNELRGSEEGRRAEVFGWLLGSAQVQPPIPPPKHLSPQQASMALSGLVGLGAAPSPLVIARLLKAA